MKRIIIIALAILPTLTLAGWWRTYGDDNTEERGYCVQQTSDGGYVAVGDKDSDLWLIKTDESGELMWSRIYGTNDQSDYGRCVRQTTDGGYIVTGSTGTDSKLWLLKIDLSGDTQWTRTLSDYTGRWVEQTSDGGYVLAGPPYVLKTDSMGDTLWTRSLGVLSVGTCVRQTSDGGYIVSGFDIVLPEDYPLPFIYKLDSLGQIIWGSNLIGEGKHGTVEYVQETADGGYIALTYYTYPPIDLVKTDSLGNTLWIKGYGDWREFLSAQQTADGGYIIAGTQDEYSQQKKCLLVKTDSEGNTIWERVYIGDYDGVSGSYVQQTVDGGYVICGQAQLGYNQDLCIIKTDSLGLLGVSEPVTPPSSLTHPVTHLEIASPIGSQITLRYSDCPQGFAATVFDASGRKVDEIKSPNQSGTLIWGECYGPGVYFIVAQGVSTTPVKAIIVR